MQKKVAFFTLGCKLNFSESSTIVRQFLEEGYQRVDFEEKADVYVINTCSVTEAANKKCRQIIKKATKNSPDSFVAVVGCYAQLKPEEIAAIEGVDIILGTKDKFKIFQHIKNFESKKNGEIHSCNIDDVEEFDHAFSVGDRTRSFLKVQDGCNYKCSYCTIPLARGKSRNPSIESIVNQANKIAKKGVKEIIITGINTGDFGRSTGEHFLDLLQNLENVNGIERFRISSIEPNLLTDEILKFMSSSPKFLPHFHIPLQAGSNKILALMRRRYTKEIFAERIAKVREFFNAPFLGIDVIVGFPQESYDDFMETYNLLDTLEVSFLHIFPYSERPNTPASEMTGKISPSEMKQRSLMLHHLSENKHKNYYLQNIGKEAMVLFENQNIKGKMVGFTENYIKVESTYNKAFINKIIKVSLQSILENGNMEGIFI